MKFTLEIELGNDAMQTYGDLRDVLKTIAKYIKDYRGDAEAFEEDDHAYVRDANGNTVGTWNVTA